MDRKAHSDRNGPEVSPEVSAARRDVVPPALALQRAAGNRAVASLIRRSPATAGRVMRQVVPPATATTPAAPTAQQQADHDSFIAAHTAQQQRVYALIDRGLATQPSTTGEFDRGALLRNSCEWIRNGRVTLTVLSQTHDSSSRRPGRLAYFDKGTHYPDVGGQYAVLPDASDEAHIHYAPPTWQGGMSLHELKVLRPGGQSDEQLTQTLIHEVQHDADQTGFGQPGASTGAPGLSPGDALQSAGLFNDYQTEFRAHWLETPEGMPGDSYGSSSAPAANTHTVPGVPPSGGGAAAPVATAFRNLRQEKIFWALVQNGYNVPGPYARDAAFKRMVDEFDRPMGVNVVNSVRVRDVIDALGHTQMLQNENAPEVRAVLDAFDRLDATDQAFLRSPDAQPFWDYATGHLPLGVSRRLRRRLSLPTEDYGPPPFPPGTAIA